MINKSIRLWKVLLAVFLLQVLFLFSSTNIGYSNPNPDNAYNIYEQNLKKLPYTNINSIQKSQNLLMQFLLTSNNQSLRDKAFQNYRVVFFKTLRNSSLSYKGITIDGYSDIPEKKIPEIKKYVKSIGLRLMWMEGCYYLEEDTKFAINKFGKFLSLPWKEYLALRVKERNVFLNDGAIAMPWDELRHRIVYWENFINKFPDFAENNEIKAKLADYLEWYISGRYGYGAGNRIMPELKKSYENFLTYNKSSKFYPIVNNWYSLLKKNKFVYEYYYDGEKDVYNDIAYKNFKIEQPYKVKFYNKDIYDGMSP